VEGSSQALVSSVSAKLTRDLSAHTRTFAGPGTRMLVRLLVILVLMSGANVFLYWPASMRTSVRITLCVGLVCAGMAQAWIPAWDRTFRGIIVTEEPVGWLAGHADLLTLVGVLLALPPFIVLLGRVRRTAAVRQRSARDEGTAGRS
jgi:hypothetical protein